MKLKVKPLDAVIILIFLAAIFFSFFILKSGKKGNLNLIINAEDGEYIYPLDKDGVYRMKGALGVSVIVVQDGKARFTDSPCPNKTCIEGGTVSRAGQWQACLPNNVFMRIEGDGRAELDAVAE